MEDLRNKHHQHTPDKSPTKAFFKEEIDYLQEEENKREIIKILSRQKNTETVNTEIKEQTTDTNQIHSCVVQSRQSQPSVHLGKSTRN